MDFPLLIAYECGSESVDKRSGLVWEYPCWKLDDSPESVGG